jgi:hypothetical protein
LKSRLAFAHFLRAIAEPLYLIGAILAITVALASAWGEYEALSYFFTGASLESFHGLHCPVLLARSESGHATAMFNNAGAEAIEPFYMVEISGLASTRQVRGSLVVPPFSTREVSWALDSGDIVLGSFILVKLDILPMAGIRARQATCGILVMPPGPGSGESALGLAVAVSALCMLAGMLFPVVGLTSVQAARFDREASSPRRRLIQVLGVCSAVAALGSLAGFPLAGLLLSFVCILLIVISLRHAAAP